MTSNEEDSLRSVAIQNAHSIQLARQQAEEALVRSLSRLRATLESTKDAILVTDGVGNVTDFNANFVTLWNLPAAVVEAANHRELVLQMAKSVRNPDAFLARVEEIYATAPHQVSDVLELADGRVVERNSTLQIADGKNIGRVWNWRDITERKRAEESKVHLAAVVESSDDAIVSKTLEGIITSWNAGAIRMFGYAPEEIIGRPITTVIPPDRIDEEAVIIQRLKRGERIEHYETVRRHKNGSELHVSLTVSPVRDSNGVIIGASKIARDISERRRADLEIREQARRLELLNTTGTIIGSTLELEPLLQAVTDRATQLSGAEFGAFFYNTIDERGEAYMLYTLSGAPREAFEKFGHPRATPLFAPTFHGEAPIRCDDVLLDPRYGKMPPHHGMPAGHLPVRSYLAVPVISRSGQVIGGLFFGHSKPGVFNETAERIIVGVAAQAAVAVDNAQLYEGLKRAGAEREQLLEAERAARAEAEHVSIMKDEFLTTLSHELRTPLSAVLGWAQLLRTGKLDEAEIQQGIDAIERNARAQTQLIEDLLDMSRIISGKIRLDVQWTDLANVVALAVDSVQPSAEAKQIRLRKIIDPHAGPVSGDPTRLQQIVWNLLTNAIKFTPRGGNVDVMLERVNSHLEITVHDSGIGIKPEFLPLVFERFRQADSSTTRAHGGLGLGLSIVKQLVELHGGTIRAKSAGEGQGATFIVTLPMAPIRSGESREHPTTSKPSAAESHVVSLAGLKVLVVDDEPDARELIKRVLVQCHAEVITAGSAGDGLRLLRAESPHVLVSDIGMPEMDGYQFIREVRQLQPKEGGKTPAIALTAFARSEDRTRAMIAGYQVHISKPIEPQELVATVRSLAANVESHR